MKNVVKAAILIGFLMTGGQSMASDDIDKKMDLKVALKVEKIVEFQRESSRKPSTLFIQKLNTRNDQLRSNGNLERLYNFSI